MNRKPTLAAIKRQLRAIESDLNAMAGRVRNKDRAHKLASAADVPTDVRACDLWRL